MLFHTYVLFLFVQTNCGGRRGRDRIVVGFITTHASSPYHH